MYVPLVTPTMRQATRERVAHAPTLIPAHYLTPDTRSAPFVLLTDGQGSGDAPPALPVAVGVWPSSDPTDACDEGPACESRQGYDSRPLLYSVEDSASGGQRRSWCLPCLVCQDVIAPTIRVEWVPFE